MARPFSAVTICKPGAVPSAQALFTRAERFCTMTTIGVFCSAIDDLDSVYQQAARDTGRLLGEHGHRLLYGGGHTGLMGILAQNACEKGSCVTGVVPDHFRTEGYLSNSCSQVIYTHTMAERKAAMQRLSDAFLILPGGIGTLDELFDTSVLIGLDLLDKPLAILNINGCYNALRLLLDTMVAQGFLSSQKRSIYRFFAEPEDALYYLESTLRIL